MSTIRVNAIKNTNTTDGGIDIDSSGHVTIEGQSLPSAGPLSNRNLIINGAMQVAQRGTSHSSNGYGSLDRFTLFDDQTTVTMSQQSLASGSPYDEGFRYFLRLSNSGTSTATNAFVQIDQQIEAQNIAQSGWNYTSSSSFITVSFWARSSVAGTYYAQYRANDTSNYVYNDSFTLSANTWTKITQSIPGNSNLVFNNDNGAGLRLVIVPYYGTGYTDNSVTDETWYQQTSTTWFRDFAQNWQNTDGATFDVTGVQLEVGSVATPFEHRSYGDELLRCQRYFATNYRTGSAIGSAWNSPYTYGFGGDMPSGAGRIRVQFPVSMRATPTMTYYGSDGTTGQIRAASSNITASADGGSNHCVQVSGGTGSAEYNVIYSASAEL